MTSIRTLVTVDLISSWFHFVIQTLQINAGSNGFESDNDAQGDTKTPQTSATFANVTFFGPYMYANLSSGALSASAISANYKRGAHIRRNSALQVYNSVFAGANGDGIFFDQTSGSAVFKGNYVGTYNR